MQKKFPLNMDELAVLEHLNTKRRLHHTSPPPPPPPPPPARPSTPEKRSSSRPDKRSKEPPVREKRPISRDSRWSDEIICDGRSVRLAVIEDSQFPRLHRSEKIINDGRRRKSHHRTKHHENPPKKDEEPGAGSAPATKEEIVREAWENVGNQPSRYIDPEPNSKDVTRDLGGNTTKDERPAGKVRKDSAVNESRRRWRTAKDPGDSPGVGKSSIAGKEKRSRSRRRHAELDEVKGLEIDRLFDSNISTVAVLEPTPRLENKSRQDSRGQTEVMDIDRLLESDGHSEIPMLQPFVPTMRPFVVPKIEVEDRLTCSENLLVDFNTEDPVDGSIETLLEKCSIGPVGGSTSGIWKIMESL